MYFIIILQKNQSLDFDFFFFLNNYKTQTILLVSQGLKLFWFLTNQVQRTWFWGYKSSILYLFFLLRQQLSLTKCPHRHEIESNWLSFCSYNSSPKDSVFVQSRHPNSNTLNNRSLIYTRIGPHNRSLTLKPDENWKLSIIFLLYS